MNGIAIIDESQGDSGLTLTNGNALCHVLQKQIAQAATMYRYATCPVIWLSPGSPMPQGYWPIYILKDPDVAGALGYHDVDPNGHPYGRVFSSVCKQAGVSLSSVLSHEVLEAWVDPYANDWSDQGTRCIAHEACDPVQNSSYLIDGIEVSNFVTRRWFDNGAVRADGKFDWLGHLTAPFQLESGGYLIVMQDGRVSQVFGEGEGMTGYRALVADAPQPSRSTWRSARELIS